MDLIDKAQMMKQSTTDLVSAILEYRKHTSDLHKEIIQLQKKTDELSNFKAKIFTLCIEHKLNFGE